MAGVAAAATGVGGADHAHAVSAGCRVPLPRVRVFPREHAGSRREGGEAASVRRGGVSGGGGGEAQSGPGRAEGGEGGGGIAAVFGAGAGGHEQLARCRADPRAGAGDREAVVGRRGDGDEELPAGHDEPTGEDAPGKGSARQQVAIIFYQPHRTTNYVAWPNKLAFFCLHPDVVGFERVGHAVRRLPLDPQRHVPARAPDQQPESQALQTESERQLAQHLRRHADVLERIQLQHSLAVGEAPAAVAVAREQSVGVVKLVGAQRAKRVIDEVNVRYPSRARRDGVHV